MRTLRAQAVLILPVRLSPGPAFSLLGQPLKEGQLPPWARSRLQAAARELLAAHPEGLRLPALVYPRTHGGELSLEESQLVRLYPPGREPPLPLYHFYAVGLARSPLGRSLSLKLRPNRGGQLQAPFSLTVCLGEGVKEPEGLRSLWRPRWLAVKGALEGLRLVAGGAWWPD